MHRILLSLITSYFLVFFAQAQPTVVCQNATIELDQNGMAFLLPEDLDGGVVFPNGEGTLALSQTEFNCADRGLNMVELIAVDSNGNTASCTAEVIVEDYILPTALCQEVEIILDSSGSATLTPSDIDAGSFDNCGISSMSITPQNFTTQNLGENEIILTITDNAGNISSCGTTCFVGMIFPEIDCEDQNVHLSQDDYTASVSVYSFLEDINYSQYIQGVSPSTLEYDVTHLGVNHEIVEVTFINGQILICEFDVTVLGFGTPDAYCQDAILELDQSGMAFLSPEDIDGGTQHLGNSGTLVVSQEVFSPLDLGDNTVILTATNALGNSSTCYATVTVLDVSPPVATCQAVEVQLNSEGVVTLFANNVDAGSFDNTVITNMSVSPNTFTTDDIGVNEITLTVTDYAGNMSACGTTCEVGVNPEGLLDCVNQTVSLSENCNASIDVLDMVLDMPAGDFFADLFPMTLEYDCSDVGIHQETLSVTLLDGQVVTCDFQVDVIGFEIPEAICQDVTLELDATGMVVVFPEYLDGGTVFNNGEGTLTLSQNAFDCEDAGTNLVMMTATDSFGNSSSCTANVLVIDATAPVALCQELEVYLSEEGAVEIDAQDLDAGSYDECMIGSFSISQSLFTEAGAYNVLLAVEDLNANVGVCTSQVTVIENPEEDDEVEINNPSTGFMQTPFTFDFYPNPVESGMNINVIAEGVENYALELISIVGQTVYKVEHLSNPKYQIDISKIEPGVYFIKLTQGEKFDTQRILIR